MRRREQQRVRNAIRSEASAEVSLLHRGTAEDIPTPAPELSHTQHADGFDVASLLLAEFADFSEDQARVAGRRLLNEPPHGSA
jgi:hypothetical protein